MTRRDQIVLAVVAVVGAIAASWMLVISPKRDQASKLESKIQSTQASLNSARSLLAQAQAARSTFRGSYTTLVRLGEAVPTDDNVPSLIYQVQSAANATGVDFGGLTVNPSGAPATTGRGVVTRHADHTVTVDACRAGTALGTFRMRQFAGADRYVVTGYAPCPDR